MSNKVWIVSLQDYEEYLILGCFSNRGSAVSFYEEKKTELKEKYTENGKERYHSSIIDLEDYELHD